MLSVVPRVARTARTGNPKPRHCSDLGEQLGSGELVISKPLTFLKPRGATGLQQAHQGDSVFDFPSDLGLCVLGLFLILQKWPFPRGESCISATNFDFQPQSDPRAFFLLTFFLENE